MGAKPLTVLIVEDGDEYLENLSRCVKQPIYLQAKSGERAIDLLGRQAVDIIYLDMRFDRSANEDLLGDHVAVMRDQNDDPERAWRYLKNNQGLYILAGLHAAGFGHIPTVLAYDFSTELRRFDNLKRLYPNLEWVGDAVGPVDIANLFERLKTDLNSRR